MRRTNSIAFIVLILAMFFPDHAWAQGKDKGKNNTKKPEYGQAAAQKQVKPQAQNSQQKGQKAKATGSAHKQQPQQAAGSKKDDRDRADKVGPAKQNARAMKTADRPALKRNVGRNEVRPAVARLVSSRRATERVAGAALAYAYARGVDDGTFVVSNVGDRVRVKNRDGDLLLDMDDDRARNLGYWSVNPIRDDVRSGAPSFCRSGAGHPVWGRQWCLDKGFGLGRYNDVRWGRATTIGDIIFGRTYVDRQSLLRDALLATVGNVVLDRLGIHSLSLGYSAPLTGVWVAQPTGPQVLLVNSGTYPVAEIVDLNRDNRADMMVFALRPW